MKDILYILKDISRILEPYKEEGIKASSAYWETQKLISEVEKLVSAFPSGDGPGMSLRQYAAIRLKVPMSGDADIDAMIRESRRAELAGQILSGLTSGIIWEEQRDYERAAKVARGVADAMIAELEKEAGK
jgi:hypothetical protein